MGGKNILLINKFPYPFILILISIGFLINQMSERIEKSPAIEYDLKIKKSNQSEYYLECEILNISTSTLFNDLKIIIILTNVNSKFEGVPTYKLLSSTWLEGKRILPDLLEDERTYIIQIDTFQPNYCIFFKSKISSNSKSVLKISAKNVVKLYKASFFTFIFKNNLTIILSSILLLLILGIIYLIYLCCMNKKGHYE